MNEDDYLVKTRPQNIRAMEREGDAEIEGNPLLEAVQACIAAAAGEFDVGRQQVSSTVVARGFQYNTALRWEWGVTRFANARGCDITEWRRRRNRAVVLIWKGRKVKPYVNRR